MKEGGEGGRTLAPRHPRHRHRFRGLAIRSSSALLGHLWSWAPGGVSGVCLVDASPVSPLSPFLAPRFPNSSALVGSGGPVSSSALRGAFHWMWARCSGEVVVDQNKKH